MPSIRHVFLVVALALAVTSASAPNLVGYSVVKLHRGLNDVNLGFAGRRAAVVIGHRENFNAHSFDIVTIYLSNGKSSEGLDIVGFWDKDQEALYLTVSGGADCLLHDFRLLRSARSDPSMVVVADRPLLRTYVDAEPVSFKFYSFKQKTDRLPGGPAYWFDLIGTQTSKAAYCDVGVALSHELGLEDYRASSQAMSKNSWRGP